MPGPPVSIGCAVLLSPGAAGPPDTGVIMQVMQTAVTANGMPLATSGVIRGRARCARGTGSSQTVCQMPVVRV